MLDITQTNRANPRQPVLLEARCRKTSWLINRVEFANISEGGCCIIGRTEGLARDQEIELRFAGLEAIKGTVRCIRDGRVGVAFTEPLATETVENLAVTYPLGEAKLPGIRDSLKQA